MKKFLTYPFIVKRHHETRGAIVSLPNHNEKAHRAGLRQATHSVSVLIPLLRGGGLGCVMAGVCLTHKKHTPPPLSRGESHVAAHISSSSHFQNIPNFKTHSNKPFLKRAQLQLAGLLACLTIMLSSCGGGKPAADEEADVKSQTPVTVTTIDENPMADYVEMNATSVFQQKNYVKANANGYIRQVNAKPGQFINKGMTLFTIKTKEAQSIGNSINILDTTFKFSGVNKIKAAEHGFITQLSHQVGDYVQDGEQLAIISDEGSFAFVLQVPYEQRALIKPGQDVPLTLPDGEKLVGKVVSIMPSVDTLSQTQGAVVKIHSMHPIPENLVARARLIKTAKQNTSSLPKAAVLANETQTEFWVMKLINDTTAVKIPVTKGIETTDRIEIISPRFAADDRIVITGNYGLSDTAKVKIVKP